MNRLPVPGTTGRVFLASGPGAEVTASDHQSCAPGAVAQPLTGVAHRDRETGPPARSIPFEDPEKA